MTPGSLTRRGFVFGVASSPLLAGHGPVFEQSVAGAAPGSLLHFYRAGTNIAADIYSTESLDRKHPNPVVADANGVFPAVYLDSEIAYGALLKTASGAMVQSFDVVNPTLLARATSRAMLSTMEARAGLGVYLGEPGREGHFTWDGSELSAAIARDPLQGVYVAPAAAPTGASGAWVRRYDGPLPVEWFGGGADKEATENGAVLTAMIAGGFGNVVFKEPRYRLAGVKIASGDWTIQANGLVNDTADRTDTFQFTDIIQHFRLQIRTLDNARGAGHQLHVRSLIANGIIDIGEFTQRTDDRCLVKFDNILSGRSTNVRYIGSRWQQPETATVPAFWQDTDDSRFNNNLIDVKVGFHARSRPFFCILNRSSDNYNSGNRFSPFGAEYAVGGILHMTGASDTVVEHIHHYDTRHSRNGLIGVDAVYFGNYANYVRRYKEYAAENFSGESLDSYFNQILGYRRHAASSLSDGVVDIRMEGSRDFLISGVGSIASARNVVIDLGDQFGRAEGLRNVALFNFDASKHELGSAAQEPRRIPALEVAGRSVNGICVARGLVRASGALGGSAGVSSARKVGTGSYAILLSAPLSSAAAYVSASAEQAGRGAPAIAISDASTIIVEWRIGDAPVDTSFRFAVTD